MRGLGRVFKRPGSRFWWLEYFHAGRRFRESSESESEQVATKLLKKRLAESGQGKVVGPAEEKVRFEDMTDAVLNEYKLKGYRSLEAVEIHIRKLRTCFGDSHATTKSKSPEHKGDRAIDITADRIQAFMLARQNQGAANATINRETSVLRHAFNLMVKAERLSRVPHIPKLEEAPPRQGFVEPDEFDRLHEMLPSHLKDPVRFLYLTAWRKSEMTSIEWRDVEFDRRGNELVPRAIRLRAANSKNKEARRPLVLAGELFNVIARALRNRRLDCPYVFHDNGEPIGDFRKTWANALRDSGVNILVHDLRRSGVRNMVRSNIPEGVAMAISGHKTRSVFDRYNIVSEADVEQAIAKVSAYVSDRAMVRKPTTGHAA
jgi:integrase